MNNALSNDIRKILFCVPTYDGLGGGEIWLHRMVQGFYRAGYAVEVVAIRPAPISAPQEWPAGIKRSFLLEPVPQKQSARPVSPLRRRLVGVIDRISRGWRPPGHFTKVFGEEARAALRKRAGAGSDVVICSDIYMGALVAEEVSAGRIRLPFAVEHHNSFNSLSRGEVRAYRRIAQHARFVVALTDEDARQFRSAGIKRTVAINNPGPDITRMSHVGLARRNVIMSLGRLSDVKQVDHLIRAWSNVANRHPDWKVEIYGDGPERTRLEGLVRDLKLAATVSFMGVTADAVSTLATGSIQTLTSRFEGWALVIGEAGVVGTPTIAYDCAPGIRAQITSGVNGVLVRPGDIAGLASALDHLMSDKALREQLGDEAKSQATTYTVDTAVTDWLVHFGWLEN